MKSKSKSFEPDPLLDCLLSLIAAIILHHREHATEVQYDNEEALGNKRTANLVVLDLSTAFDVIDHRILQVPYHELNPT